ncbi:PepSY domain-containing protein [Massilia sp. YIM B02763]|uniref:PepSY domain-containing protein n=1 Tax=Massilia sp. YIM B02763 TaxID=3050130 RepID=UPI0025B6B2A3|nr:PepSY domain-containing protein [Massilia sp. YIM B02763]MDN4051689.1 PepSY domain-containing protein [Massilia sp. YIM B02763]
MSTGFKRGAFLVHRWTGVAMCVLMVLWFASGMVMLFAGYPKLTPWERLAGLPTLPAQGCCVDPGDLPGVQDARRLVLTSIRGAPHYVLTDGQGAIASFDAASGRREEAVDRAGALQAARSFLPGASATYAGTVGEDRWTHSRALDVHRPLHVVEMGDAAATRLYVSSRTGQVMLDAPRAQRLWNFVGAWLHWLYMFRNQPSDPVWTWLVIALSAVGTVSAFTGALNGIWRWRFGGRYKSGAKTPFRETAMRWHHVLGLAFGAMVLAWIFSGLMSMNPLGVFDAHGPEPDLAAYAGGTPGARRPDIRVPRALALLREAGFAPRELEWRVLDGEPFLLARDGADRTRIVVANGAGFAVLARWPDARLLAAARHLMPGAAPAPARVDRYDAYYYARQEQSMYGADERRLPVLRLVYDDAHATWVHLDPCTGEVASSMDRSQRLGRWLFNLLHSWDLPAMLDAGWLREAVLLLLGAGGLLFSGTAVVIGARRLRKRAAARSGVTRPDGGRTPRSSGTGAG